MDLLGDSIGITDLLSHRECPRRMSYGLRRHIDIGEQSDEATPEVGAAIHSTDYGSAIHKAIEASEDGFSDEDAIQQAWNEWGHRLTPADLTLLERDLEIYHERDYSGVRTLAVEDDFRVPLFEYKGRQIYFRFKLDRLYERVDAPGNFVHIDYKSSKWAKSQKEVHEDLQLWAYNFGIHEVFPECDNLRQIYDQLRYGPVPTSKTPAQREEIKAWLIKEVTKVLEDEDVRADGLHKPRHNQWCAWCPIIESCPVIDDLTEFGLVEIAELAPRRPKTKKDGTPGKLMEDVPLDEDLLPDYARKLDESRAARKVLENFEDRVKALIKQLPPERMKELHWKLQQRGGSVFLPEAAQQLHEQMGPAFYDLVKITKTGLEEGLGADPDLLEWALKLALKTDGAEMLVRDT